MKYVFLLFLFASCSKSECIECKSINSSEVICKENPKYIYYEYYLENNVSITDGYGNSMDCKFK